MKVQPQLYTESQVKQLIKDSLQELRSSLQSAVSDPKNSKSTVIEQWCAELLPTIEQAVAIEVVRRHVQGVTFAVWSGPPASGKGTNITAIEVIGKAYAEVSSQGFETRLPLEIHEKLLSYSVAQATIMTGTGGIFNNPSGEYAELFEALKEISAQAVAQGEVPEGNLASPLIELMFLLKLVQGAHRIQVDLWPRKIDQFEHYLRLVEVIRNMGGKVVEEFVHLRLIDTASMQKVEANPSVFADESVRLGTKIDAILESEEYLQKSKLCAAILDPRSRYQKESEFVFEYLNTIVEQEKDEEVGILISELLGILKRMEFRFSIELEKGLQIRPDAYPLTVLRRLKMYVTETSPVFLYAPEKGVKTVFVSVSNTPQQVIHDLLVRLVGMSDDSRWEQLLKYAGEIANDIVYKKELIVTAIQERVWGIVSATRGD